MINLRLYGHLHAGFGLAGGAKATARALQAAGCDVYPVNLDLVTHPPAEPCTHLDEPACSHESAAIHVDLVHTNPNILASTPGLLNPESLSAPLRIGYWAWELEQFPGGWEAYFAHYHEIWCPSAFAAQSLSQRAPIPVVVVPHLPDWPRMNRLAAMRRHSASKKSGGHPFVFLTLFDYWSTSERKNPLGVIEAFWKAFPLGQHDPCHVQLLIKTSSSEQFPDLARRLHAFTAHDSRIRWIDSLLPDAELDALYQEADALISLHRSEGFGLTLAEAMAMGIPVVATGYSGCLDFMPVGSACLVSWQPVRISRTIGDYPAGAIWAEPSLSEAAEAMRALAEDSAWAARVGEKGRAAVQERLASQRVASAVQQRLGRWLLSSSITKA